MKKEKIVYPLLAVTVIVLIVWLGSTGVTGELVVAVIGPLTGPAAQYGISHRNGIKLAADQINASGGIKGKKISLVFLDDENDKIKAAEAGRDAIFKRRAVAIIGTISSDNTMNLQRICEKSKIPLLTAVSTNPFITRVNFRYTFRCLSDDNIQAEELAKYTTSNLKLRRMAIIHDSNKYGSEGARTYRLTAGKLGQSIIANESYDGGTLNFKNQLAKIKQANPDGLLIWGLFEESALIARQAREMGISIPIFGPDAMAISSFLDIAGSNGEGIVVTFPFNPERGGEKGKRFVEDYLKVYQVFPDSYAAHGFDAMTLIASAIAASDGTGPGIRDALAQIKQYDGVSGKGGFDETGNETRSVQLAEIRNGKFVPLNSGGKL